jgi:hypothetical protein
VASVLLSARNAGRSTVKLTKFLQNYIGPCRVTQHVGAVGYLLVLCSVVRCHNGLHVSQIEAYKGDCGATVAPPPIPQVIHGDLWYEVDDILDHKIFNF